MLSANVQSQLNNVDQVMAIEKLNELRKNLRKLCNKSKV